MQNKTFYYRAFSMRHSLLLFLVMVFIIVSAPFSTLVSQPVVKNTDSSTVIKSAFNPKTGEWNIGWPGRISQYDLVYLSPPVDPMQGIPLGNGDVGALFWCNGSKMIAVLNKCDLWDDAEFTRFQNWKKEEEDYNTTLRHACRIVFDFKFPIFDVMYLSDFNARLDLAKASLTLTTTSPFGTVEFEAFIDYATGMLFVNMNKQFEENVPVDISIERFGSRTFSHWYSQINRDASIGLSDTRAGVDKDAVFITQQLSSGTFAVGATIIQSNNLDIAYTREHSRSALMSLKGNRKKEAQLVFAVTPPESKDPLPGLKKTLSSVDNRGIQSFRLAHENRWQSLWNRSFMDYGDDYLNALWHMTMYYAISSQGGKYPGRFTNGLWGWSRDVQNWNFYFHWNQQQLYWPLNAAGFHELVDPYLDYRFNSLPFAKKDAQEFFHTNGAFISDVTERRGYNSLNELKNHTPVAEIALDFWRQYQYTCDENFLKEKALPFIIEAARYFESLFVKESDGLYHAVEGTGYEGWIKLKDSLTELVYARALFTVALEALKTGKTDIPEAKKWQDLLLHMAPLPTVKADEKSLVRNGNDFKLNRGLFKDETVPTDNILAAGWGIKEEKYLTTYFPVDEGGSYGLKLLDGIFPTVPSSAVFPSGLIGLAHKNSQEFDVMTSTALLYTPEVTGWDPVPIVLARIGRGKELLSILDRFPGRWQIYCNGWGHWGLEGEVNKDAECFFRTNKVRDVASTAKEAEKFPLPMWPFRHMSMESMSVLTTAMNESLLQSHDGVLRIASAFPENKSGRFMLHARGGFIVSGEIHSGVIQWICVKSLFGNNCKLNLPWNKAVLQSNMTKKSRMLNGELVEIKTKTNEVIMILPEGKRLELWTVVNEAPKANENVRIHSSGKAQLGLPRMF